MKFKFLVIAIGLLVTGLSPAYSSDSVSSRIGQTYRGENILPLRALLNLNPYIGSEVDYVVLRASTAAGRGHATLKVNGFNEGASQVVGRFSTDYFFQLQPGQKLGQDIKSLQLQLNGHFAVDVVSVYFKSNFLEKRMAQTFRGANTLKIRQLLGLDQSYRGKRIKSVILTASTAAGRGQAELFVNDRLASAPQAVGQRLQDYFFDLGRENKIGEDIMTLQIELRGHFYVESVAVEFESDRRDHGPNRLSREPRDRVGWPRE